MNFWTLLIGAISGYLIHAVSMKVSFKRNTIKNKIKVFAAIIDNWVNVRNYIVATHPNNLHEDNNFDQLYGRTLTSIGEAILVSEDNQLTRDINALNERFYRTDWNNFKNEQFNSELETLRSDAINIVQRMRDDISKSTILEISDFAHIFSGLNFLEFFNRSRRREEGRRGRAL